MTGGVVPAAPTRGELGVMLAACLLAGATCSLVLGRDLNWDYFNYHGYAALLLRQDRLAQDFFAAGYQGYMNPLAFAPWAWMQQWGWHSAAIGAAMGALHALNLVFLYLIARAFAGTHPKPRLVAAVLTALAALNGAFIGQVGSSFYDITTTPLVMAALWLLVTRAGLGAAALACALAGAAVALKWTNAPYGLAVLVTAALGLPAMAVQERLRRLVLGGVAMGAGFVLLYGAWGWKLMQTFGSPVFPLFNRIFRAPDFPAQGIALDRFVPQSLADALLLPWRLVEMRPMVFTEIAAPDLRPALVLALGALALVVGMVAGLRHDGVRGLLRAWSPQHPGWRTLLVFSGVALVAWLLTSANARYAVPLLLLLAPMLYVVATRVMPVRAALLLCTVVAVVQGFHTWTAGNPRWNAHHWTPDWLPAEVPQVLRDTPQLYVSIGRSSESFVAAHVHPDSPFVNPIGLLSLANDGPGWARFVALRERWQGRTRVLVQASAGTVAEQTEGPLRVVDEMADRLGLRIDTTRCERMEFNRFDAAAQAPGVLTDPASAGSTRRARHVLACVALPKPVGDPELQAQRARAAAVLDALERRCPKIYQPAGVPTEGARGLWSRSYGRYDLFALVDFDGGNVRVRQEFQVAPMLVGDLATWEADLARHDCRLPHSGLRGIETLRSERAGG